MYPHVDTSNWKQNHVYFQIPDTFWSAVFKNIYSQALVDSHIVHPTAKPHMRWCDSRLDPDASALVSSTHTHTTSSRNSIWLYFSSCIRLVVVFLCAALSFSVYACARHVCAGEAATHGTPKILRIDFYWPQKRLINFRIGIHARELDCCACPSACVFTLGFWGRATRCWTSVSVFVWLRGHFGVQIACVVVVVVVENEIEMNGRWETTKEPL